MIRYSCYYNTTSIKPLTYPLNILYSSHPINSIQYNSIGIFNEESPSSSSASSPSSSSFMRFNGPVRSNDESAIASDLKIMRIMMSATGRINNKDKSHLDQNKGKDKGHSEVEGKDQGKDKDKDKGSDKHNDKDHDKDKNKGGESNGDNGKDDHMQLSSKCLVDQLPNTVSVPFQSFRCFFAWLFPHVSVSSVMPPLRYQPPCNSSYYHHHRPHITITTIVLTLFLQTHYISLG